MSVDPIITEMAEKFICWPLPASVCTDHCTTYPVTSDNPELQRLGTNLLSYAEAEQMFTDIVGPHLAALTALRARAEQAERERDEARKSRNEAGEKLVYQQQRSDKYWLMLCDTAEALGKVAPEAAPYTAEWARQLRADLTKANGYISALEEQLDSVGLQKAQAIAARAGGAS